MALSAGEKHLRQLQSISLGNIYEVKEDEREGEKDE